MKAVRQYKSKAKWSMYVDPQGIPLLGYYSGDWQFEEKLEKGSYKLLPEKTNVLLYGSLMLTGTERGRSSAHFTLVSSSGWRAHMTMVGTYDLINAIAYPFMDVEFDEWRVPGRYEGAEPDTIKGAVMTGYWTVAKQGTEISLTPAPRELFVDLLSDVG